MKSANDGSALHLPLASAGLSQGFTKAALANGFNTLGEIFSIPLTELTRMEWVTTEMVEELAAYLKKIK